MNATDGQQLPQASLCPVCEQAEVVAIQTSRPNNERTRITFSHVDGRQDCARTYDAIDAHEMCGRLLTKVAGAKHQ
jgi:hypothetical protein